MSVAISEPIRGQDTPTPLLPRVLGSDAAAGAVNPLGRQIATPAPAVDPVQSAMPPQPEYVPEPGPHGESPAMSLGTIPAAAAPAAVTPASGDLLAQIAGPFPAPALQAVARELMLDRAIVDTSDPSDRARAFYSLGLVEDAAGAAVESRATGVAERALAARTLLALGREPQACERADVEALPRDAEPAATFELLEVLALCKLVQGADDAARLIAELLREQGGGDALFHAAFRTAAGERASLPEASKVERVRPIHIALLRRAGREITADLAARADLALTPALARDPGLDRDVRIVAAERAVQGGLMPVEALVDLYIGTSLEEDLLRQVATGNAPIGPLARAHLFALVTEALTDVERMGFVEAAYRQATSGGVGAAVAEALGEDLAGIVAEPDIGNRARLAIEILVRGDRSRSAVAWIDAGELPGPKGVPAFERMDAHVAWALVSVSAPEMGFGVAAGALGADASAVKLNAEERRFVAREVVLMRALGDAVSPVLVEIAGRPEIADSGDRGAIAVLRALAPLAGRDLGSVGDEDLGRAVAVLAAQGWPVEARRLAVEALIARIPG